MIWRWKRFPFISQSFAIFRLHLAASSLGSCHSKSFAEGRQWLLAESHRQQFLRSPHLHGKHKALAETREEQVPLTEYLDACRTHLEAAKTHMEKGRALYHESGKLGEPWLAAGGGHGPSCQSRSLLPVSSILGFQACPVFSWAVERPRESIYESCTAHIKEPAYESAGKHFALAIAELNKCLGWSFLCG